MELVVVSAVAFIVIGVVLFSLGGVANPPGASNRTTELQNRSTNKSFIGTIFETWRNNNNTETVNSRTQLSTSESNLERAYQAALIAEEDTQNLPARMRMAAEKEVAQHSATLAQTNLQIAQAENMKRATEVATDFGLELSTLRELVLERARMQTILATKEAEAQIEFEKHKAMKMLDFSVEELMAKLDTHMAELKTLWPYHERKILGKQLSEFTKELEEVRNDNNLPPFVQKEEVSRLQKTIRTWKKDINGRDKRLSEGANRPNS